MKVSEIVAALITNTVVPELLAYLKARQGAVVDESELKALLLDRCARDIAIGEAFLRAHGVEP